MHPDITQFSTTKLDWRCKPVDLGLEMSDIWSGSMLVNYGADSILRCSHLGPHPILKLAHQAEEFRLRLQHEFEIIQDMTMTAKSLPIPRVDDHPLRDDQGTFGYRLEFLVCLEKDELVHRLPEVREAVQQLHEAGFSHGDLSQSNMMKNKEGAIVLIDFGCAGKIGTQAASSVPSWVYENAVVTVEADQQALTRLSELGRKTIAWDKLHLRWCHMFLYRLQAMVTRNCARIVVVATPEREDKVCLGIVAWRAS
jgi:serine/threonine protein kinase